jgi:hypothetical protein
MKKPLIILIVLVVLGAVVWSLGQRPADTKNPAEDIETISAPVSETTQISDKLSQYKNDELGFAVKYPSGWEREATDNGVVFTIPAGTKTTVGKLESRIAVSSGKCAFPPVTTIKDRTPMKVGELMFNMITMSNSVQGRSYFDRMYSLQKDSVCYIFSFSSVTSSPASKGYKGSEATQLTNNNKAVIEAADQAFIAMVKSFEFVTGPAGVDETQVVPLKK